MSAYFRFSATWKTKNNKSCIKKAVKDDFLQWNQFIWMLISLYIKQQKLQTSINFEPI